MMEKEVSVQEVIISNMGRRGKGIKHDPVRALTQVFTKGGELIAEHDPHPTTFNDMDLVNFAGYCQANNIEIISIRTVEKWLDSIEN